MRPTQVRVGFVSVVRPTFKGDSATAARGSLAGLERLGQELGFEVVVPHLPPAGPVAAGRTLPTFSVHDGPAALRAAEQLAAADLDFLLIQHTTFATGELLTPLLRACSRVGVWALPESAGGGAGTGPLPLNSLCGLNMTLSYAEGMRRSAEGPGAAAEARVKWFYGSVDASWFRSRLSATIGALRALRTLASARVLQIG